MKLLIKLKELAFRPICKFGYKEHSFIFIRTEFLGKAPWRTKCIVRECERCGAVQKRMF